MRRIDHPGHITAGTFFNWTIPQNYNALDISGMERDAVLIGKISLNYISGPKSKSVWLKVLYNLDSKPGGLLSKGGLEDDILSH